MYDFFCSFQILIYSICQLCGKHEQCSTKQENILPKFEEVLVNALSLQNYGDF